MKNVLINLLFKLLGNNYTQTSSIQYLFGVSTVSHEARKNKWENALVRLWQDKDLLDFLYYQAETDKESVFKGKVNSDLSKGARIRTLYLVYSAKKAYENKRKGKITNATEREEFDTEMKQTNKAYKNLVDV